MSSDSLPARPCVMGTVVPSTFDQWRAAFPCWLLGHRYGSDLLLRRKEAEGHIVGDSSYRPCARCGCWLSGSQWTSNRGMRRPLWTRGIQLDRDEGDDSRSHNFGAGPFGTWAVEVHWRPQIWVCARWYGHRRGIWCGDQNRSLSVRAYRRLERAG
jgi:hypothetical protein